jgi:zinc transport system substrate-binding protein
LLAWVWLPALGFAAGAPAVVVSILPLHSLAAAVMQGAGSPQLLVDGGSSPHAFSLRPSTARALADADLVVWVGPEMESFLVSPLARHRGQVLTLLDAPGMRVLAGPHQAHAEPHSLHHHASGERDPHLWLDPRNAIAIAAALVQAVIELDPARAALYRANGERLQARLQGLDKALARRLEPLRERPFLVFHDAYRYLETRYGLHSVGAAVIGPERRPGARRLQELRAEVQASGARCVFSEPQFASGLLEVLTEDSQARAAVLDPLGADLEPGPDAYFLLMGRLADQLAACLQDPPGGSSDD